MENSESSLRSYEVQLKELELAGKLLKERRAALEEQKETQATRSRNGVRRAVLEKVADGRNTKLIRDVQRASQRAASMSAVTDKMLNIHKQAEVYKRQLWPGQPVHPGAVRYGQQNATDRRQASSTSRRPAASLSADRHSIPRPRRKPGVNGERSSSASVQAHRRTRHTGPHAGRRHQSSDASSWAFEATSSAADQISALGSESLVFDSSDCTLSEMDFASSLSKARALARTLGSMKPASAASSSTQEPPPSRSQKLRSSQRLAPGTSGTGARATLSLSFGPPIQSKADHAARPLQPPQPLHTAPPSPSPSSQLPSMPQVLTGATTVPSPFLPSFPLLLSSHLTGKTWRVPTPRPESRSEDYEESVLRGPPVSTARIHPNVSDSRTTGQDTTGAAFFFASSEHRQTSSSHPSPDATPIQSSHDADRARSLVRSVSPGELCSRLDDSDGEDAPAPSLLLVRAESGSAAPSPQMPQPGQEAVDLNDAASGSSTAASPVPTGSGLDGLQEQLQALQRQLTEQQKEIEGLKAPQVPPALLPLPPPEPLLRSSLASQHGAGNLPQVDASVGGREAQAPIQPSSGSTERQSRGSVATRSPVDVSSGKSTVVAPFPHDSAPQPVSQQQQHRYVQDMHTHRQPATAPAHPGKEDVVAKDLSSRSPLLSGPTVHDSHHSDKHGAARLISDASPAQEVEHGRSHAQAASVGRAHVERTARVDEGPRIQQLRPMAVANPPPTHNRLSPESPHVSATESEASVKSLQAVRSSSAFKEERPEQASLSSSTSTLPFPHVDVHVPLDQGEVSNGDVSLHHSSDSLDPLASLDVSDVSIASSTVSVRSARIVAVYDQPGTVVDEDMRHSATVEISTPAPRMSQPSSGQEPGSNTTVDEPQHGAGYDGRLQTVSAPPSPEQRAHQDAARDPMTPEASLASHSPSPSVAGVQQTPQGSEETWRGLTAALRVLTTALVCDDNLSVIEADDIFQRALCSDAMSTRTIEAAMAGEDMELFSPGALSVAVTRHLRSMVRQFSVLFAASCSAGGGTQGGHAGSAAVSVGAVSPQDGLIPDMLLKKHAQRCSYEAEFRSLIAERWVPSWDLLLNLWSKLLAVIDIDTIVQSFTPVLVSSHVNHPKRLEKASSLLHAVVMDQFADILQDLSGSDFFSDSSVSLSPSLARTSSLADTLPASNPLGLPFNSLEDEEGLGSDSQLGSASGVPHDRHDTGAAVPTDVAEPGPDQSPSSTLSARRGQVLPAATPQPLRQDESNPFSSDTDASSVSRREHAAANPLPRASAPSHAPTVLVSSDSDSDSSASVAPTRPPARAASTPLKSQLYSQFVSQSRASHAPSSGSSEQSDSDDLLNSISPRAAALLKTRAGASPSRASSSPSRAIATGASADSAPSALLSSRSPAASMFGIAESDSESD